MSLRGAKVEGEVAPEVLNNGWSNAKGFCLNPLNEEGWP
jgi:hypothetical protein